MNRPPPTPADGPRPGPSAERGHPGERASAGEWGVPAAGGFLVERAFLVERYLSPAAATGLVRASSRVARACAGPTGHGVRYLYSAYMSTEDTCFCLFLAPSAEAVRAVNREADFALDRVIDAVLLLGGEDDPTTGP